MDLTSFFDIKDKSIGKRVAGFSSNMFFLTSWQTRLCTVGVFSLQVFIPKHQPILQRNSLKSTGGIFFAGRTICRPLDWHGGGQLQYRRKGVNRSDSPCRHWLSICLWQTYTDRENNMAVDYQPESKSQSIPNCCGKMLPDTTAGLRPTRLLWPSQWLDKDQTKPTRMDRKEKHTKVKEKVWDRVMLRVLKDIRAAGSRAHTNTRVKGGLGDKYQSGWRDVSFGAGDYAVFGAVCLGLCRKGKER